jgi:hypothetical protein
VASDPPLDLVLAPITGRPRPLGAWLSLFHLVFVALDPFSERSAWLVETSGRILTNYDQADCRVAFLVAGTPDEARQFLGHWALDILTFADPDLTAVRGFGLATLPAIVHLGLDGTIVNAVEGWDPPAWRALSERLSKIVDWRGPVIPGPRDPAPFEGEAPTAA